MKEDEVGGAYIIHGEGGEMHAKLQFECLKGRGNLGDRMINGKVMSDGLKDKLLGCRLKLTQDRVLWQAVMGMIMNTWVP